MKVVVAIGVMLVLLFGGFVVLATKLFFPYNRVVGVVLYFLSWIPFLYAVWLKRALVLANDEVARGFVMDYWLYFVVAVVLVVMAYVGMTLMPIGDSVLKGFSAEELEEEQLRDEQAVVFLDGVMGDLVRELGALDFEGVPSQEDKAKVVGVWADFVANSFELDLLLQKYRFFHQISFLDRREAHERSFLIAYEAFLVQYQRTGELVAALEGKFLVEDFLNQGFEDYAIPEGVYFRLKQNLTMPSTGLLLNAGRGYFRLLGLDVSLVKDKLGLIDKGFSGLVALGVKNPLAFLEKKAFELWLPFQKEVSVNLSYVRTASRPYFISVEQIGGYKERFLPGDVILERREWNATNVGIPGFWTHAALYLGTTEERKAYFGEEVGEGLEGSDENGFPFAVIEAKRDGVILTSLEYTADADSVAVLRPNVAKEDRLRIVKQAIGHLGKPYDYNFDFLSDDALVCSELVYKAYEGVGVKFETELVNGRHIMSPNYVAEKFDREFGGDDQDFDLVLFLDGSEKSGKAFERDEEAFRNTWKRPKWFVFEEYLN